MTEEIIIYLVFGILFLVGLIKLFLPEKVIDIFAKWYGLWGMKVDRSHYLWNSTTMRVMGLFYLICTGIMFVTILQAR